MSPIGDFNSEITEDATAPCGNLWSKRILSSPFAASVYLLLVASCTLFGARNQANSTKFPTCCLSRRKLPSLRDKAPPVRLIFGMCVLLGAWHSKRCLSKRDWSRTDIFLAATPEGVASLFNCFAVLCRTRGRKANALQSRGLVRLQDLPRYLC